MRRLVSVCSETTAARAILVLAFTITALAWWISGAAVQDSAEQRFEFRSAEIETAVVERMEGYETVLWSGVGLFDAAGLVTRQQFGDYVAALDLDDRWPGIQGIGWSVPLQPGEIDAHEATIRAEGFGEYEVRPAGQRDQYSAIVYLEPFDWRNQRAFGFDMASNAERRAAMYRARDTGQAATSAMITLVQETDEDVQHGFLTYVPVYAGDMPPDTIEGRQEALLGWVYAPFRMNDLMRGVLGSSSNEVDYQIFDGWMADRNALLFDSNPTSSADLASNGLKRQATVLIQGRPWTMVFRPGDGFTYDSKTLPNSIAIAGLLVEALLFAVVSALGTLHHRAESIAEQRTAELQHTNEALHQRSEELERRTAQLTRSNDELRQLAHATSHDLQEPLRTMTSYSSLVSTTYADQLDDEGRRWLSYIGDGAKRLSNLLREMGQLSSIDQLNLTSIGVDLHQIMDAVQQNLADVIVEAEAVIEVEDLPIVNGDPTQLERLLTDLVHNAITYRRSDVVPRILVKGSSQAGRCRVAVRDNGVGIEPELQQRIFEVFRRAAPKTTQTGTGMGLAICRKIVQAHGGDIGVVSAPDHGTEFWFEIPTHAADTAAKAAPLSQPGSAATPANDRSSREYA